MSLYGALFAGVSGLKAQSDKIGVISDNIANVNTVGYKGSAGVFQSLVTSATGGANSFSPGGVLGQATHLISQQGLLQSTNSPTDIAISGNGFFVVNQTADGTGQVLYTRAGSFTQDATGNFINAAGFFLQAWPLDREGRLPGEPGNTNTISSANLASLVTVNVQNLTGVAAATSTVSLGANLKASETIFPGTGLDVTMDAADVNNRNDMAKDIIIPQGTGNVDSLTRGDGMVVSTGNGGPVSFTYGGFSVGRSVTDGTGGDFAGTGYVSGAGTTTLANPPFTATFGSNVVTVHQVGHNLQTGDVVDLTGNTGAVRGIPSADLIGTFVVTRVDADNYTITVADAATTAGTGTGGAGTIVADVRPFDSGGFIGDANLVGQSFLGITGTSVFNPASLSFSINTLSTGTVTFTYKSSSPNAQNGEFNNMTNLAAAINAVNGLVARVSGGKLYVSALDSQQQVHFINGSAAGINGSNANNALYGIDWVRELGLADVSTTVNNRFSTMQGLADEVNAQTGLSATIASPLSDSTLTINVNDPLDTITFTDDTYGGGQNVGSVLSALGLAPTLGGTPPSPGAGATTGAQGPAYDPSDATKNMASGSIQPQFSRPLQIFDSLGTAHSINIAFIKTAVNTWAVEVYALDPTQVTTTDGLLASGNVHFNGDGTLQSVDSGLLNPVAIAWTDGAEDSAVTFNWGTAGAIGTGKADGLSQFDTAYKVNFANQNGAQVGELSGVSFDADGFITVSFSNGQTQNLFKTPLADFASPDQLAPATGNVFSQTSNSGEVNLSQAGTSGVGKFAPSSLEASNVELADQLTDMIVAQRAYQANTKVIQTADGLLNDLDQIIQ
jgi:flagellar hook-basal body protein